MTATPGQAERDPQAGRSAAGFARWAQAEGLLNPSAMYAYEDVGDAFAAGMREQRDLDAAQEPGRDLAAEIILRRQLSRDVTAHLEGEFVPAIAAAIAERIEASLAAQEPHAAPDLSAGLADLESELRDVTRQVALCRSTKIPCVLCEQEITRAMGAVQRWAQDVAEHERTREPQPAPELAVIRELLDEILGSFSLGSVVGGQTKGDAIACVGRSQLAQWRKRGLPS